ncbi:hypothetical protein HCH_02065 [Hahella chejuensis KCTC 2396]|uniref:Uncharacterized protein n=1 Tax=Hahella chejuensis (strain KCTC 2396) TaxID=349521 RepID=Q2SKC8_HAHCH|nr:hypothetical protein HCH_02065 [Hahella chejuensis KCTC 2396]
MRLRNYFGGEIFIKELMVKNLYTNKKRLLMSLRYVWKVADLRK